jgi:hypothetical protein
MSLTDGSNPFGFPNDSCVVSGSTTPNLVISKISTNETGDYQVTVTGGFGSPAVSTNAHVVVNLPATVNISYIRSLENAGNNWQETDVGDLFNVTGVVTTFTNATSGNTASYYIQDATGGINFFVTGDSSFRPTLGDILSGTGTLSMFNNNIELFINNVANPYSTYAIVGHTNILPAPIVFGPLSLTNNPGIMETNIEGRLITLTNVGFTGSLTLGSGNTTLSVTNAGSNVPLAIFFPGGQDPDVANQTLSSRFAWTITGVVVQNRSGNTWGPNGYQVYVTRVGDILTNPPPPVTVAFTRSGNDMVLNWTAVPYTEDTRGAYSYTVLAASNNVVGPYLPLASGLVFNTTNGTYTDVGARLGVNTNKFYRVVSP